MNLLLPLLLAGAAAAAVPGSPPAGAAPLPVLGDEDLRRFGSEPFDKGRMMFKRVFLGRHDGKVVVATYPCGDVCPQATVRIIAYLVDAADCDAAGGVLVNVAVPRGPALGIRAVCKPPPLVPGVSPPGPLEVRCAPGFVPRLAASHDMVCGPPEARARTREENRRATERRDPAGAYGRHSCQAGFVWREAFARDFVCVTPAARAHAREENRLGSARAVTSHGR